jgi:signal-transduction protein with cAMP-binding, CBS, and nucleotidyltransferase domain
MDLNYFLRMQPGFDKFSNEHVAVFSRLSVVDTYPASHVFTSVGEQSHTLHLIMAGAVMVSGQGCTAFDADRVLRVGEWFGLQSLVANLPSFERVTALEKVTVACFDRAHFDDLLEFAHPVGLLLLYMLTKQLARTLSAQNKSIRSFENMDR